MSIGFFLHTIFYDFKKQKELKLSTNTDNFTALLLVYHYLTLRLRLVNGIARE